VTVDLDYPNLESVMPSEIHLLRLGYDARCSQRRCISRATVLARWTDDQGRRVRQRELCERHAQWLKDNVVGVRDLRDPE
jgi:hypothetical protein